MKNLEEAKAEGCLLGLSGSENDWTTQPVTKTGAQEYGFLGARNLLARLLR